MDLFYDTQPFYPYICISGMSKDKLKDFVEFLDSKDVIVTKFYDEVKRPASDGIHYENLLRFKLKNNQSAIKPNAEKIYGLFEEFRKITSNNYEEPTKDSAKGKVYFKQLGAFLESERKRYEIDREFFGHQLERIYDAIANLNSEKSNVKEVRENLGNKISGGNLSVNELQDKLQEYEKSLNEKEYELKEREQELLQIKQDFTDYQEESNENFESYVMQLRDITLGIDSNTDEDIIQKLKILVFGESNLTSNQIYEIFNQEFIRVFGEDLSKKCINAKYLDYDRVKNSNIVNQIKGNKYDYIIAGPHPHSMRSKDIKQTITSLGKERGLKSKIHEFHESSLSRDYLKELAETIIKDWDSRFE